MSNEPADGEAFEGTPSSLCHDMRTLEAREVFAGTPFGVCDYIRTVETRGTEPKGGHEILCSRGKEP